MADKVRFTPVVGTDDSVKRQPRYEGRVYFATDTRKIYLDTDKDDKLPVGGAGNSGIYYGVKTQDDMTDVEYESGRVTFTLANDIEGDELPGEDDLILNKDGCFYRVDVVNADAQSVVGVRQTVAGSGGGGGGSAGTTASWVDIISLDTSDFIYGQPAYLTLTPYSELDRKGEPLDKNGLTIRWKIIARGSKEYLEGTIDNLVNGVPVEFDFGSKLFADQYNDMEFRVEGARTTNMETIPYAVNCVKLALKQNSDFTPLTLYQENFNIVCTVEGQISKRLEFWFDGELKESRDLDAVDFTGRQALWMQGITHGSHTVEMRLFQTFKTADGIAKGAEVPSLKFEIAVAVEGETDPIIWVGNYQEVYNNYDRIQIPYMVYTPGTTTSSVKIYKGSKEIGANTVVFSTENTKDFEQLEIIDATVSNVTGETLDNTYSITSGKAAPKFINFKVLQTGKMVLASQNNLLVKFDAAGRSNSETTISREKWQFANTDAFGDKATNYKGEFEGFNWYNNGWILDENKNTCLRISNGAKFKIPLGNTRFNSSTQGQQSHTFEFQFKIRNVQNYEHLIRLVTRYKDDSAKYDEYLLDKDNYDSYEQFLQIKYKDWYNNTAEFDKVESVVSIDTALCNYFDTAGNNVGFCLGTQDAFFKTNESTLTCNYVEDRIVNMSLVYQKAGDNIGLVSMYLNGVLSGAAKITDTNAFTVQNPYIVFNSDYCDIDLYKFRVYNTNLTIAEVLNNYAVDLRDVTMYNQSISLSKFNETTGEYEFDFNAMTTYNENNPDEYLMPYLLFSNVDALSYSKANYIFPTVQFVNPGLDRAYKTGELEKSAQDYVEADFPITWMSQADAETLANDDTQTRSNNYFVTINGVKKYIEKAKLEGYSTKIKKDKKKGFTVPVMRHLSKVENYYIHHSPSFTAKDVETNVQGTSSQYYPRRNYKIRCKEKMYADRGPFEKDPMYIQYFFMDNDKVGTTKFTMKIDYMESSGSYNTGFANLVHGAYTKHPLYDYKDIIDKPDTSYLRTNIMGFPILTFHKKDADNTIFIGRYNMNLDKGSDENFGFKLFKDHDPNGDKAKTPYVLDADGEPMAIADVVECWEFSDNNRGYCSFRDPEQRPVLSFNMTAVEGNENDQKAGYHLNANGSCPAVADSFEYRYHKDADVLDYLYKPDAELKETILEDYEGEITAGDLDDLTWRKNYLLEKMANYEKVCQWVWSTNTEMVDSDSEMYKTYGVKHGGMTYSGFTKVYNKATKETVDAVIYDSEEVSNIYLDEVWDTLQNDYGFTEGDMNTEKFGTKDELASTENKTVWTHTDEDIFQAYAAVTGYTYKSYTIEEVDGAVEVRATFDIGTVVLLSVITEALAANPTDYETDRSKALAAPYRVGSSTYYFDTQEYRLAKFANEFTQHFDKEYALVYFVMTEVFECYDSRGKNCMMASWGPQKEGGEYIWYPIFYDIDTQLGINNTGIPSFEYYVNATEEGCYSTNDSILWGNIFRCFFDDIKTYYQNLRTSIIRRNDDGSTSPNSAPIAGYEYTNQDPVKHIENWYTCQPDVTKWWCCKGARPLIAINMDEWYKYITIINPKGAGYQGMDGKPVKDSAGSFLYALQGDRGLSRQQFLMRRINFIDSWLTRGTYMEGAGKQIKFRTSANDPSSTSDWWIDSTTNKTSAGTEVENLTPMLDGTRVDGYYEVDENGAIKYDDNGDPIKLNYLDGEFFAKLSPFQRSYVTLATDNAPLPSIEYQGTPVRMEFPSNVVTGVRKSPRYAEQLLYLYGADYLKDIGDVSRLYPREFELVGATQLQRIILGNDHPDFYNTKLKSPKFDASTADAGKPLLKEVVLTNVRVDDSKNQVLDFTSAEKLQIFRALGMNLATAKFAPGVALHTLHLPKTLQTLNLTEARSLKGIVTNYNAPTAETLSSWVPQRGLYLAGITDVTDDQLSNVDVCNNNINTIEILGGNMGYDSYTLLKRLYDIKEAQSSASNKGNLKISLTGVHWSPYTLLEKGYEYNADELSQYYVDNGHYQLISYEDYLETTEDDFTWDELIANKSLYIKTVETEVLNASTNLTNTQMLEDLANNTAHVTYLNPDEVGNEIPRITGNIYIDNEEEIDEGWIRNTLQMWYPELTVFVKTVKKAYSAQFIQVDENDGSWNILQTQKISQQQFADNNAIFFTSPYETYADMTQKDHYDFYGWSSKEGDASEVIPENEWINERLVSGQYDYRFFIIYEKHPYEFVFYNDDNNPITWIDEEGNETSILKIPYQETLRAPLLVPISKNEADLPDDKIYKFLGYSKTAAGEPVDLSTMTSSQDLAFYAVYDSKPMSVYDNFTYIDNAETYFRFEAATHNDGVDGDFSISGYRMYVKDGVTLKGKITLPAIYKNADVIEIGKNGFVDQAEITHIYFQNKQTLKDQNNSYNSELRYINDSAFLRCDNLKIFDWPTNLRIIYNAAFKYCPQLKSYDLPDNVYYIGQQAFQFSFAPEDWSASDKQFDLFIPGSVSNIASQAFQGYDSTTGTPRHIHRLFIGDENNPVKNFSEITIAKNAFNATPIDYVVVYCETEDYSSWTAETVLSYFPILNNENAFKFPNQNDAIPN